MTRTQEVLEKLGYAYFETDNSGVITAVNNAFCDLVGAECEQILGENLKKFFNPAIPKFLREL